ncbi:MAG: bZIP transcription factor [Muribaculaceae bacterium]|nr:bZIP transcription factor [Muribaculaceae bacterium]
MKQLSQQQAGVLLDRYMDGLTTVEEEAVLRRYFSTHNDIPDEWQDYKLMFDYLDSGMEDGNLPAQEEPRRTPLIAQMGRRWWGIAAAACITAAIVATAMLQQPSSPTLLETPAVTAQLDNDTTTVIPPAVETEPQQLASATPASPVGRGNASATKQASRNSRLQAENAKLAQENERLQRELADLRRRAFIIDLEANGFRAVQDEDGSIVLIDIEQEIENELNNHLNNQPTTNIPAL